MSIENLEFRFFGSTARDMEIVRSISPEKSEAVYATCARWLSYQGPVPHLVIYCVADPSAIRELPDHISSQYDWTMNEGAWFSDANVIVIGPGRNYVEWRLVHELGHAYLDLMSRPYRFPLAMSEGFARGVEAMFTRTDHEIPEQSGRWCRPPHEYRLSALQVCEFGLHYSAGDWRRLWSWSWLCYWLMAFSVQYDETRLPGLLAGTIARDIREPRELLDWLCTYVGLPEDEFEDKFRALISGEGEPCR